MHTQSTDQHKKFTLCLRGLAVLAAGSFLLPAGYAQDQPADEAEVRTAVITGSFIPTAETVGSAPVDILEAGAIERVGTQDVLDTLKKLNPVFAGNGNVGQTVNNGGGGEAYVAIRNLPTLVLLDGKRLANSAFSSGYAVDLNSIPLAMIERIEILKDGASAIYGSDAIGGVVNIITKKNFNGVEIGGRYGFTTRSDDVTEYTAHIVGGTSTEKSSFVAGAQYYKMDPLLNSDREIASLGIQELIEKGLLPPTYVSPTFAGRVQSEGVSYILAGSPFAVGAPGYNPAITAPPVTLGRQYQTVAAYLADNPGVYIPIASTPIGQALEAALDGPGEDAGWPLLNTTLLGPASIQGQDRRQFFGNATHELFGKQMEIFANFLYANTYSEGALAPSPMSSLANGGVLITGDSPINPFQIDLGLGGAGSPRVRTRFMDVGNRLYENQNDVYHIIGGLRGSFENDYTYEVAYNYNRNDQVQWTKNSINGAALSLATKQGSAPGLSQLRDSAGEVPLFNPFALPGGNSQRTIDMLRTTQIQTGFSELWGVDGNVTGMPFSLPAGKFAFAVGGGFYTEALEIGYDGLTQLGMVPGGNQFYPMPRGRRDSWAGFIETRFPIFSEDKNIPVFHSLELTAAGRVETFDPGGDSAVPKVGLRWQPIDNQLTLRGSYSQSFLAPNVFQLFGAPAVSYDTVRAGGVGQVQMNWISNPELEPADADQWGVGFVFSPKFAKGLTVSVDYYHIQTENDVYRVGAQAVADSLVASGAASEFAGTFFFDDGSTLAQNPNREVSVANWGSAGRPLRNGAEQETDGLDVRLDYELDAQSAGRFLFYAVANVLFNYEYADPLIGGPYEYSGQFTENGPAGGAQGTLPDFIMNMGVTWDIWDFTYSINARYVPEVDDLGDMHESAGEPSNYYTISGEKWVVDDYYSIDMRLAYEIGKRRTDKRWYDNTVFAVGCQNITDTDVPLIASAGEDNTDKSTYDILGRFVYFEVTKRF